MPNYITLPVDGIQYQFLFDEQAAADSEMDGILKDLVAEIGPLKRPFDPTFSSENGDTEICFNRSQASFITGVREDFSQDPNLSPTQVTSLSSLFVSLMEFNNRREIPIASNPGALNNQYVRAVTYDGYSYVVRMPGDDEECGEVVFFTNDDNSDGVDWLDFVFQLIVGILGVIFALGAGSKAIGRIIKKLRVSDLFDRLKALLRSSTFRGKLKKFVDLLPGGKRVTGIYEALKAILEDLWEIVLRPGIDEIKSALSGIINAWTITWSVLSWLLRFVSGGTALAVELGVLLGALTIKVLAPGDAQGV